MPPQHIKSVDICWHWNRAKPLPQIWWRIRPFGLHCQGSEGFATAPELKVIHNLQLTLVFNACIWMSETYKMYNHAIVQSVEHGPSASKHFCRLNAKSQTFKRNPADDGAAIFYAKLLQHGAATTFCPILFNAIQVWWRCHAMCRGVLCHNVWDCMRVFERGCMGAFLCLRYIAELNLQHISGSAVHQKLGRRFGSFWYVLKIFWCLLHDVYQI